MLSKIKENTQKLKTLKLTKDTKWEVLAYLIRISSCIIPAVIIMYTENSWKKASLSLLGSLVLVAIAIILYQPIKNAMSFIPGVVPFGIFVAIAIAFKTMADAFLIIGISGLCGSVLAVPFHYKYLQSLSKDDEILTTLSEINDKLGKSK